MKFPWTVPTAQDIVEEVGVLSHDQRFRRMIELGRQSAQSPRLAQELQTLAGSEVHYERMIGVAIAWLWAVDKVRPTPWDVAGVLVALCGMAIIMFQPQRA